MQKSFSTFIKEPYKRISVLNVLRIHNSSHVPKIQYNNTSADVCSTFFIISTPWHSLLIYVWTYCIMRSSESIPILRKTMWEQHQLTPQMSAHGGYCITQKRTSWCMEISDSGLANARYFSTFCMRAILHTFWQ